MADMYEWAKRVTSSKPAKAREGAQESMDAREPYSGPMVRCCAKHEVVFWENTCDVCDGLAASERVAVLEKQLKEREEYHEEVKRVLDWKIANQQVRAEAAEKQRDKLREALRKIVAEIERGGKVHIRQIAESALRSTAPESQERK